VILEKRVGRGAEVERPQEMRRRLENLLIPGHPGR
jgi:hypothetical protein